MADTITFFRETLPQKIADNPDLLQVGAVYQFDVEGAGTWTLDLVKGEVREGATEAPGCVIAVAKEHWDQVIDTPMMATQFFMMGQLKASNLAFALQLQRILG